MLYARNMRPPQFINEIGLLTEKTISVHCISLDSTDVNLLAEKTWAWLIAQLAI